MVWKHMYDIVWYVYLQNKSAHTEGAAAFRAVLVAKRHEYANIYM